MPANLSIVLDRLNVNVVLLFFLSILCIMAYQWTCDPSFPRSSLTGTQLVPDKFRCFGGPSTEIQWCEITQIFSIVFSSLAFLGLLLACYTFQRNKAGYLME